MFRVLTSAALGSIATLAFILSCGSGGPSSADAGEACDCSGLEPSLTGRIVLVQSEVSFAMGDGGGLASVTCGEGGTMLGGGCALKDWNSGPFTFMQSGPNPLQPERWRCIYDVDKITSATIVASAFCLMPPVTADR